MNQIQDRKKQRREYLRKKRVTYFKATLNTLIAIPCSWYAFGSLFAALFNPFDRLFSVIMFALAFIFGAVAWTAAKRAKLLHQKAKQLPYVPPVSPATLPAEEVLLRGSDASAQEQSQVLLRGTHNSEEADGQELLRSSQGQDGD